MFSGGSSIKSAVFQVSLGAPYENNGTFACKLSGKQLSKPIKDALIVPFLNAGHFTAQNGERVNPVCNGVAIDGTMADIELPCREFVSPAGFAVSVVVMIAGGESSGSSPSAPKNKAVVSNAAKVKTEYTNAVLAGDYGGTVTIVGDDNVAISAEKL